VADSLAALRKAEKYYASESNQFFQALAAESFNRMNTGVYSLLAQLRRMILDGFLAVA